MRSFVVSLGLSSPGPVLRGGVAKSAVAWLALLALGGCSGLFGESYSSVGCPSTDISGQLGSLNRFEGGTESFSTQTVKATLRDLKGTCSVDDTGVTVSFSVKVLAELGPAARDRSVELPYFVAVLGRNDRIIAKEVLTDKLSFPPAQNRVAAGDSLTERIPLRDPHEAPDYHILLGFQLSPEELAYNRTHGGG